jgi:restriction system protein
MRVFDSRYVCTALVKRVRCPPRAFEVLCQRLLRESGFVEVQVIGRSGDGGIDGKGVLKLNPLLSMRVVFQCKRYRGTVSAATIRDFRGAMAGRADKGLLLTTGTFSRDARGEANREGAPPIDLLDGDGFVEQLKALRLGVHTQMVEQVEIDHRWFEGL